MLYCAPTAKICEGGTPKVSRTRIIQTGTPPPGILTSYLLFCSYFNQTKLTSFQRQLSLYGFLRITQGRDKGGRYFSIHDTIQICIAYSVSQFFKSHLAYYHEFFLRGRADLHRKINRLRVKGTGHKKAASPETEPDLWKYEFTSGEKVPARVPSLSYPNCELEHTLPDLHTMVSHEPSPTSPTKAIALHPCPVLPSVPPSVPASLDQSEGHVLSQDILNHSVSQVSFSSAASESDSESLVDELANAPLLQTIGDECPGVGIPYFCKEYDRSIDEDFSAIMEIFMDECDEMVAEKSLICDPIFLL